MLAVQHIQRVPAPVDTVSSYEPPFNLHHFDEIHLLSLWRHTRILPRHNAAVGEIAGTKSLPLRRTGLEHQCGELPQVVFALHDATTRLQQVLHQGTFD